MIRSTGYGSGFVHDSLGDNITNSHVASGSREFEGIFASGERQTASLVTADADADLTVIKVYTLPEGWSHYR